MEKIFYPDSLAIVGLSSKPSNIPRLVLENLIRWGYKGRILGINPRSDDEHVNGIKMYKKVNDLPIIPDLVYALVPARFIPSLVEECGRFGVKRMAIPSGGFDELGKEGENLAMQLMEASKKYKIRFVGPNGLTVANTSNGLCLPFVPTFRPPRGGFSIISQSGGVGLMLWNHLTDENLGMAKFASIGNKLDLDEVDFLEYFGRDPETKIIGMYLESIPRGKRLLEVASKINKPIIILKSNTTEAGRKAAISHTAALSNDDDIINTAFSRAGIIRIYNFKDFISVSRAFELPPLRGNRIMLMSPAGGITVMLADLCEKIGFQFADPGREFYEGLKKFSNAGVINFSNPLDMGDIYDPNMYAYIFYSVMHNDNVDGALYVSQWPHMPRGEDVFYRMFHTDLSKEATGTIVSSGKPMAACIFGLSKTIATIKKNINFPIFNSFEEMVVAMKKQCDYYMRDKTSTEDYPRPKGMNTKSAEEWLKKRKGNIGEESLELMELLKVPSAASKTAGSSKEAAEIADKTGYPVVMKVISPDALHKSEAGGVLTGVNNAEEVRKGFKKIKDNLLKYKKNARFKGVRIMKMAEEGYDMFIGGKNDEAFGPVVFFGFGGIYIEVFRDVKNVLCPESRKEIKKKLMELKSIKMLSGTRGNPPADIDAYIDMIERISHLMNRFPEIKELDLNPVRIFKKGKGALALDARLRIER